MALMAVGAVNMVPTLCSDYSQNVLASGVFMGFPSNYGCISV
jgi:hypothetical protein